MSSKHCHCSLPLVHITRSLPSNLMACGLSVGRSATIATGYHCLVQEYGWAGLDGEWLLSVLSARHSTGRYSIRMMGRINGLTCPAGTVHQAWALSEACLKSAQTSVPRLTKPWQADLNQAWRAQSERFVKQRYGSRASLSALGSSDQK